MYGVTDTVDGIWKQKLVDRRSPVAYLFEKAKWKHGDRNLIYRLFEGER